jgi:hypothetical protein
MTLASGPQTLALIAERPNLFWEPSTALCW